MGLFASTICVVDAHRFTLHNHSQVLSRNIPQTVITHFIGQISNMEVGIRQLFSEEKKKWQIEEADTGFTYVI